MWLFRESLNPISILIRFIVISFVAIFIIPLHEYAHAFAAYKLGDTTALHRGRLTLNPLKHMDVMGIVCMFLFGYGWAKPVPVDTRNFKNRKIGTLIVSAAGPAANILAALSGALLLKVISSTKLIADLNFNSFVLLFFKEYIHVNVALAVFNLLPIPPLDGFGIAEVFIPEPIVRLFYANQSFISIITLAAIFMGFLDRYLTNASNFFIRVILFLVGL